MLIEKILIFILFLGPLVFFHELGHFLFARLFGVRVETFSIGFGPKLFKFKRNGTVYALSLIPLGGYVKMFGDDPLSEKELTPEEEAVAYTKKSKWARFWIVFGGPLANLIMAFCIYFILGSVGEKVPQMKFGQMAQESIFTKNGVTTGDILVKVNDFNVTSIDDLNLIDSKVNSITVSRGTEELKVPLSLSNMEFYKAYSKVNAPLRSPIVTNTFGDSFLLKNSESSSFVSYEELLMSKDIKKIELFRLNSDNIPLKFHPEVFDTSKLIKEEVVLKGSLHDFLNERKLFSRDLFVKRVLPDSPADKAGIKAGEVITAINGKSISSFNELRNTIQALNKEVSVEFKVLSDNNVRIIPVIPTFREINGTKFLSVGVESGVSYLSMMTVSKSLGPIEGISKAWKRTVVGTVKTVEGFKKLITGEVSIKHVGGPIAIGQVASDSFSISLSMFFRLMALISINLGIINLFPIPVLDGGHIVFILLEIINRGPLSRRKLQYAQQFGMSLLFLLIFVAIFNDVSRLFR